MPLLKTTGAASAKGFGFTRLSSAGGYYYSIPTLTQYYQPQFLGVQPISTGWIVSGSRPNTERFTLTLNASGNILAYTQDSSAIYTDISSMHRGGASAFSTDAVPVYLSSGVDKLGFISNTPSYTGTPATVASGIANRQILGIDYSANRVFSHGYLDNDPTFYSYIASTNYSAGTTNWVRRWVQGTWSGASNALIRPGDSTNVWISSSYTGGYIGFFSVNKSTAALTGAYKFSLSSLGSYLLSFITDTSGNMYFGTLNGQIVRVNTANSVDWANSYSVAGQSFGYTHVCYYNGYLYAIGSQHPNGNFLAKISPTDGSVVWCTKITTPLYGCYGISASANGIMVVGEDGDSGGYKTTYLLNYPLAGGITGTKGAFVFSSVTPSVSALTLSTSAVTGPTLTTVTVGAATTYPSSLNSATSILSSKQTF